MSVLNRLFRPETIKVRELVLPWFLTFSGIL
jgi:hypothetical protein